MHTVKQDLAKHSPWKVTAEFKDKENEAISRNLNHGNLVYLGGDCEAHEGMIPRSVRLIFATCNELKSKGWTYKIEASFLEIYNEQIRDLLGNGSTNHEIRLVNNEVVVTNLRVSIVFCIRQQVNLDFDFNNSQSMPILKENVKGSPKIIFQKYLSPLPISPYRAPYSLERGRR